MQGKRERNYEGREQASHDSEEKLEEEGKA